MRSESMLNLRESGFSPADDAREARMASAWGMVVWLFWAVVAGSLILCVYSIGALIDAQAAVDDERTAWHKGFSAGVKSCGVAPGKVPAHLQGTLVEAPPHVQGQLMLPPAARPKAER